jgi:hypothetical protein
MTAMMRPPYRAGISMEGFSGIGASFKMVRGCGRRGRAEQLGDAADRGRNKEL